MKQYIIVATRHLRLRNKFSSLPPFTIDAFLLMEQENIRILKH